MELTETLTNIMPLLRGAKEFLENEAGLRRSRLALTEVSESKDGENWIITFFYSLTGDESYYDVEVSKRNSKPMSFRRLESGDETPR